MRKRLIIKSLIGLAAGAAAAHILTLLINYFTMGEWLICMPELTEDFGTARAVILQTVLSGLFGMVALGGMCVYDIEQWSLLHVSVMHCALILITYLIVGLILYWFSFNLITILIVSGIIILVYFMIWLVMYTIWKKGIREMNTHMEEYKKQTEETGC